MPTAVRKWWIHRTDKEVRKAKEKPEDGNRGPAPWAKKPGT
jgi:hypothetical protein